MTYAGCPSCRPECAPGLKDEASGHGAGRGEGIHASGVQWAVQEAASQDAKAGDIYHIVEVPGGVQRMVDCEVPTEYYYKALEKHMRAKFPRASEHMIEHLMALESFLDVSIVAGFSYGTSKAKLAVTEGQLLGHIVGRHGASADPERTQAIREFAPLKDQTQVRQLIGCTNWVRWYMPTHYAAVVKNLSEYMKPTATFPAIGLGAEVEVSKVLPEHKQGHLAVLALKLMAAHSIQTSSLDEAAAITGDRPLEQIADACGYAWGSTQIQMTEDLSHFNVLLMSGKGFTPAQQVWQPLTLEMYAQLMGKRSWRKLNGTFPCICWTDHANVTRQQVLPSQDLDAKHLRWLAEIVQDGSEIRSLSGRSAHLGDGTSRNPKDRDELIAQRTADAKGLIGQVRNFDLEQFLSFEEEAGPLPWGQGDSSWVSPSPEHKGKEVSCIPFKRKVRPARGKSGGITNLYLGDSYRNADAYPRICVWERIDLMSKTCVKPGPDGPPEEQIIRRITRKWPSGEVLHDDVFTTESAPYGGVEVREDEWWRALEFAMDVETQFMFLTEPMRMGEMEQLMASAGVNLKIKILHVPDYAPFSVRQSVGARLYKKYSFAYLDTS